MPGANTLAYYERSSIKSVKKFYKIDTRCPDELWADPPTSPSKWKTSKTDFFVRQMFDFLFDARRGGWNSVFSNFFPRPSCLLFRLLVVVVVVVVAGKCCCSTAK